MPDSAPSNVVQATTGAQPPGWLQTNVSSVIALILVIGCLAVIVYKPEAKTEMVAIVMVIVGYYFGSSQGSRNKDNDKDKIIAALKGNG